MAPCSIFSFFFLYLACRFLVKKDWLLAGMAIFLTIGVLLEKENARLLAYGCSFVLYTFVYTGQPWDAKRYLFLLHHILFFVVVLHVYFGFLWLALCASGIIVMLHMHVPFINIDNKIFHGMGSAMCFYAMCFLMSHQGIALYANMVCCLYFLVLFVTKSFFLWQRLALIIMLVSALAGHIHIALLSALTMWMYDHCDSKGSAQVQWFFRVVFLFFFGMLFMKENADPMYVLMPILLGFVYRYGKSPRAHVHVLHIQGLTLCVALVALWFCAQECMQIWF